MVRVETDTEKIRRLEGYLAECYRLTGADPDRNEDWRLASRAVDEVRRLRQESDQLEQQLAEALADSRKFQQLVRQYDATVNQMEHTDKMRFMEMFYANARKAQTSAGEKPQPEEDKTS